MAMNKVTHGDTEFSSISASNGQTLDPSLDSNEIFIDPVLEKQITSKFDKFMMPQMAFMMAIAYLDRSNIGNAVIFGFKEGIGLQGTEFNNLAALFYPLYVLFEVPWVMAVKRYGANNVLAVAMFGWSAVSLGTGFINNYHQAIAMRMLLGLFEAALFPSLAFLVSTSYTRQQQGKRIAILYGSTALSGAFGGLFAYAIQLMGTRAGLAPWRWLFIIEGCISFAVGFVLWMSLPRDSQKAWFLSVEERALMRSRTQRDAASNEQQRFEWKYLKPVVSDPLLWIASVALFCSTIPLFGFGTFLPTIIEGLGYNSLQANYLSIPVYIFACLVLWFFAWLSDRLQKRAFVIVMVPIPVLIGYAIVIGTPNNGAGLFAMFLVAAGIYPFNTLMVTWVTNNLENEHVRSIGIPLLVCIANASGLASSQIYPSKDSPRYTIGNSISLCMEFIALLCVAGIWWVVRSRNAKLKSTGEDNEFVFIE